MVLKCFVKKKKCVLIVLYFTQYLKLVKAPVLIHSNIEYLIKNIDGYTNNPKKSATTNVGEHILCGCSMPTTYEFDGKKMSLI